MKTIILTILASFAIVSTSHAADIYFKYNNQAVSLKKTYQAEDFAADEALIAFADFFTSVETFTNDVCVQINKKSNALKELANLRKQLHAGFFEELLLQFETSDDVNYPITLKLYDMPNESELGSVKVKYCR